MMRFRRPIPHTTRGVTLFEVLIVVTLLALISGGIAFGLAKQAAAAKTKLAKSEASTIRTAVRAWQTEEGTGCPSVDELVAAQVLDRTARSVDPWKRPYRVVCEDGEVTVASDGPDRTTGNEDDLVVPPLLRPAPR